MNLQKLLWHSNAPFVPTGYGQQTALFAPHLSEHYDLAISAFYGLDGAKLMWHGIPLYPGFGADFGNGFLLQHAKHHFDGDVQGGMVFCLMDIWPLNAQMASRMNLISWCPIDHEPALPAIVKFFKESGAVPVAMSRFGEEQLKELDPLYCPHAVDTSVYRPHDREELDTGSLPKDAFVVAMVAANKGRPSRKCFFHAMQAFAIFKETHDDALLYLHTVADPSYASGEDIMAIAGQLGLEPNKNLLIAPRYQMVHDPFPPQAMAQMYSCFDVLLNCSMGEGFGIPILEAAACGVPSVVTNFTAMPEVASEHGWAVGCRPHWTAGNSLQAIPDVEEMVQALELAYGESGQDRNERSAALRDHALNYDIRRVMENHMLPILRECGKRFGGGAIEVPDAIAVA
jgi:glycosyltransferase involved in cell wall biosynthesis